MSTIRMIILSIFAGLIGIIIFFIAGSCSSSSTFATVSICLWFLVGACLLSRKPAKGWPFLGSLINIPLWIFFIFLAESGQSNAFSWVFVACFGFAHLGVFSGRLSLAFSPLIFQRILIFTLSAAILFVVILFIVVRMPTSIPADKQQFIGEWKTLSGFELQIHADGTARILNNKFGSPNLNIPVGSGGTIDGFKVQFASVSTLEILKPAYFGKSYKIDIPPKPDGSGYMMVLNGITFLSDKHYDSQPTMDKVHSEADQEDSSEQLNHATEVSFIGAPKRFDNGQIKQCILAREYSIGDIKLPSGSQVNFYKTGVISEVFLGNKTVVLGQPLPSKATLFFDHTGRMRQFWLREEITIQGHLLRAMGKGYSGYLGHMLHANGKLRAAWLAKEEVIDGVPCASKLPLFRGWWRAIRLGAQAMAWFYDDGHLQQAMLARDTTVEEHVFKRGDVISLRKDGTLDLAAPKLDWNGWKGFPDK